LDKSEIPALKNLLKRYNEREDLQDAYPEVLNGEYQALINWAAGVVDGKWFDADASLFLEFKSWYKNNVKDIVRPKNESIIREILKLTDQSMNNTLNLILDDSDINEHLPTLFLLIIEFDLKRTLELGVREGNSTVALTEAASRIDGHVWSIDVDICNEAKQRLKLLGLEKYWSFTQGDDITIGQNWNQKVDHIFIDTSHSYKHTLSELKNYIKFLEPRGFITFHDTRAYPGILRAILDFISEERHKYRFYNYFNNNGFAILRKIN
jgi:predicted O-methyltransferase YrrM